MRIIKNSGDIVEYDEGKLRTSLERSGVPEKELADILAAMKGYLYDGINTRRIYKLAHKLLKKVSASHAARYNLRTALQQLGPAGFFFEKFISIVFTAEGFDVKLNLNLQGKCVSHEVDLVVRKLGRVAMVECKFHAHPASVSDVKVPMYILSRFNDLKDGTHQLFGPNDKIDGCKVVTNNRFSADAETFAQCAGLELLSWNYPVHDSLKMKIDRMELYPITCLGSISAVEKEKLLFLEVITVAQLLNATESLAEIGISENRSKRILNEAFGLCNMLVK